MARQAGRLPKPVAWKFRKGALAAKQHAATVTG